MQVYKETPWLKRVLIPFWVIRFILMAFLLATLIYATELVDEALYQNGVETTEGPDPSGLIAVYVLIVLLGVCFLLDITAILLFVFNTLRPLIFLVLNIIQTGIWVALFILNLLGALDIDDNASAVYRSYGGWIVSIVVLLLFIGLLIYASVVYHRDRKDRRGSRYIPAKRIDYEYQPDNAFEPYSLPASEPVSTPNNAPTNNNFTNNVEKTSARSNTYNPGSRHINLFRNTTSAKRTNNYGQRQTRSNIVKAKRISSPRSSRFYHSYGSEFGGSQNDEIPSAAEGKGIYNPYQQPDTPGSAPNSPWMPLSAPLIRVEYVVSRQSLSDQQAKMYWQRQRTYGVASSKSTRA